MNNISNKRIECKRCNKTKQNGIKIKLKDEMRDNSYCEMGLSARQIPPNYIDIIFFASPVGTRGLVQMLIM